MTSDECIRVIREWLLDMKPRGVEAVEDAVAELRIHVLGADAACARSLAPRLVEAVALAGSARLLWGAVAAMANTTGPAYSASGAPIDSPAKHTVRI